MKKIEAIIRSSKFEDIKEGLMEIGIQFFTFFQVKGHGMEKEDEFVYRGVPYDAGYIPRLKIEIIIDDDKVDPVVETIQKNGRTGKIGDGKIIITNVESFIRIRTGEEGHEAL